MIENDDQQGKRIVADIMYQASVNSRQSESYRLPKS